MFQFIGKKVFNNKSSNVSCIIMWMLYNHVDTVFQLVQLSKFKNNDKVEEKIDKGLKDWIVTTK